MSVESNNRLHGKRVLAVVFSHYPSDPRPRRTAESMAQAGMEVEVVCLKQRPDEAGREVHNGVRIRRVNLQRKRGGKWGYLFQYGWFITAAFLLLAGRSLRRRYHLVHVHNMPDVLVFSALLPKLLGARVILDLHDPMPELMMTIFGFKRESRAVHLLEILERLSIRFADLVLTVNEGCRKLFSSRSCRATKVRVIMNSPDETIFQYSPAGTAIPCRQVGQPFVLMFHGSIVERHGLDLLVRSVAALREEIPGILLRIYGQSTPHLEEVMGQVRHQGLEDSIKYMGPAKLEQIARAIPECDLGIIPNRRSIFTELNTPTRIFEYLAKGKPVIAPDSPGITDYFGPGQLLYFRLGDGEDLTRSIRDAWKHPDLVGRVTAAGQEVYRAHRWENERTQLLEAVQGLLIPKGPAFGADSAAGCQMANAKQ